MSRKIKILNIYLSAMLIILFLPFFYSNAQTLSSDAIAIRVVPNPKHLSAYAWYLEQGFSGSPQALTIDGYEAVRDGRTVYVNAANIITNTLYTNIYIISYNQESEQATIDIFGRIITNWKFNTNVTTIGHCRGEISKVCLNDRDCSSNDNCDSMKARIVRDVRRLADLAGVKIIFEDYRARVGHYPKLSQGTYLPQKSASTWPSWSDELSGELRVVVPTDPINKMGPCSAARYQDDTCWDEERKQFDDQDTTTDKLDLPNNSLIYTYHGTKEGDYYDFCGVMETGYLLPDGDCSSSGICLSGGGGNNISTAEQLDNNPPVFTGYSFPLNYAGEEYRGYIEAVDADGDAITWSMASASWLTWPTAPALFATAVSNQKMIYALQSGSPGIYYFTLSLDDNRGESNSVVTKDFYITVATPQPVINTPLNCTEVTRVINSYINCSITATHDYNNVTSISANGLPDGLALIQTSVGLTSNAVISGTPTIDSDGSYTVVITAVEASGQVSDPASFSLTVNNYCGDNLTETPNTEGQRGVIADGNEACDGNHNIANTAVESSINKEYACTTNCEYTGGYCGDTVTQSGPEECDDGKNNNSYDTCYNDCTRTTCGDGKIQAPNGNGQTEQCDGVALAGTSCQSLGFENGNLSCDMTNCQFNSSSCCDSVDGVWSAWVDGVCVPSSGSYGTGSMLQTHTCSPAACGGADCVGSATQSVGCCLARTTCGSDCGLVDDECGGTIPCGACCTDTCLSLGYECGNQTVCGSSVPCGICETNETCVAGHCVLNCTDTCLSLGYECGNQTICGSSVPCGTCGADEICNAAGICIPLVLVEDLNISGDCYTFQCPATHPYPVACSVNFIGGNSKGCVANLINNSSVFFKEGEHCGAGDLQGSVTCSNTPGTGLNSTNCPINKPNQYHVDLPSDCPN